MAAIDALPEREQEKARELDEPHVIETSELRELREAAAKRDVLERWAESREQLKRGFGG